MLRGRCRSCGEGISIQYPLVELVVAAIWLGMALWIGPGLEAVRGAIFLTLLFGIAIIDGRHRIIPTSCRWAAPPPASSWPRCPPTCRCSRRRSGRPSATGSCGP
jgi:hypothetical protein